MSGPSFGGGLLVMAKVFVVGFLHLLILFVVVEQKSSSLMISASRESSISTPSGRKGGSISPLIGEEGFIALNKA